jgi:dCTP deaminase
VSILTKNEILKEIKSGRIVIDPFDEKSVGPASIDFHLGDTFRVFRRTTGVFNVGQAVNFDDITKLITVKDSISLLPGESIHGITVETLTLPDDLCGWIQGRSTLARLGLLVHITANFIHPGMDGRQVLEMTNAGPIALNINVGIPICQIIIEETRGRATYKGKFTRQETP